MNSKLSKDAFNLALFNYLADSPTPFHAVASAKKILDDNGFIALSEADSWTLEAGKKYYVDRNKSSLIAFTTGADFEKNAGINMVGAHTDSPCLKVKPNPERTKNGYFQLGVEVYGGALLNPWFDRDLSLAGRVSYESDTGDVVSCLIDFTDPVAVIPSLAIHLDRQANENRTVNQQNHLPPILFKIPESKAEEKINFNDLLIAELKKQQADIKVKQILDHELFFYDTQKPAYLGLNQDFIASARLDNLLSCYTGLMSLINNDHSQTNLLVCSDHEEVGSASSSGAQGPFLKSVLERICGTGEALTRCLHDSLMISADNAHGIHPNYSDKHDENHGPVFNEGPVIKLNANQRYATNSETSALFKVFCQKAEVPVQSFVVRSDMACGSTIGPITAAELGVKTVDVGLPTFAMHSIRELAGSDDAFSLYKALICFFQK